MRDAVNILVVDSVLGSRFSLVQAASIPGFVVDACASIEDARAHLGRTRYALVFADHALVDGSGLDFLAEVQATHPEMSRALVTGETGMDAQRLAIEQGGLVCLLMKPWQAETLRQTLRDLFGDGRTYSGWAHVDSQGHRTEPALRGHDENTDANRYHEVLLRGLLAGLNSCETENEVFELVHEELASAFCVARWLWVNEDTRQASSLSGDWAIASGISVESLPDSDRGLLRHALRCQRVTRLYEDSLALRGECSGSCCLGFAVRIAGRRAMTGLVWADAESAAALVSILRDLQGGLQMALTRISEAQSRARAARKLARQVSEELRTPVGALSHAIDRLRGEAARVGLSSESLDRISSESERVVRAVEHLEGEMLTPSLGGNAPTS